MTDPTDNLVTAAADLARRSVTEVVPTSVDILSPLVIERLRDDEHIEFHSVEKYLAAPLQPRGSAIVHDPHDFAAYVNRLGDDEHTTIWAHLEGNRIVAVLDDHSDAETAGWRAHTITLAMQDDPDWTAWNKLDGQLVTQAQFADFLEGQLHTIVDPPAADLLEVATTFHAKKQVTFRQAVAVSSGDVQLTYDEESEASAGKKGTLEIPRQFTVRLAPWTTADPVEVTARLRWRITDGRLGIGYALLRPDRVKRDAFDSVVQTVAQNADSYPLYLGTPPQPVPVR